MLPLTTGGEGIMLPGGPTVSCPLTPILRDAVTLGGRMSVKLSTNIHHVSGHY